MAQSVHLFMTSNGEEIQGESTITSLERENSIECLSFVDEVSAGRESQSSLATGERTYAPIKITKRICKASPLIMRSLCNNEVVECTFKFFRPSPAGDGTTEQFFTVVISEARVAAVTRLSPDVLDSATASLPPTEEIAFVFGKIRWTYEPSGAEHEDSWKERA